MQYQWALFIGALFLFEPFQVFGNNTLCSKKVDVCFHQCCPEGADITNDYVNNIIYVLSSNRISKFADWVAYSIEIKNLDGRNGAKRNWKKDPSLSPKYTLITRDYKGANKAYDYDKGHQAPLANFSNSKHWAKANYLSNITPQQARLNQGAWVRLEVAERMLIKKHHYKYVRVVTGPYYNKQELMPALPSARVNHLVPNGYWKAIAVENSSKNIGVVVFKLDQYAGNADFCDYITDLASIKELTHIDIFPSFSKEGIDVKATNQLLIDMNCPLPGYLFSNWSIDFFS